MTAGSLVPTLVHKELRALTPVFVATLALVPLCALGGEPELMTIGLGVYVLGGAALGAQSIGHEFTYDTLGQLLALPGSRTRLLTVKLLVLAGLLAILAAVAAVTLGPWAGSLFDVFIVIPALLAVCMAPVLTMVGKGAMAGTVFTVAVYAGLWLLVPGITSPSFPADVDIQFHAATMFWMAAAISGVAAVAGAVVFGRLESTGSPSGAWVSGRRVRAGSERSAARPPQHPVRALLHKELRLQMVALVVAGLYVVAWALVQILGTSTQETTYAFEGGTLLYQITLAVLIGALASAEERGLGTLHWQTLQPYAAWKQWTIKITTALALSVLLVVALPVVLRAIGADAVEGFAVGLHFAIRFVWSMRIEQAWTFAAVLLTLTTIGLFTSSFNRSSLHALLAAGVLAVIGATAIRAATVASRRAVWQALDLNAFYKSVSQRGGDLTWAFDDFVLADRITLAVVVVATVGFLLMLVVMGLRNHRSAETPHALVTRQVVTLLAYGVVAGLVAGGGQSFVPYFLATH
jgi:hypothetical protein